VLLILDEPCNIVTVYFISSKTGPLSRASSRGRNFYRRKLLVQEFLKLITVFFVIIWEAFVTILHPNSRCVLINSRFNVIAHFVPKICTIDRKKMCHNKFSICAKLNFNVCQNVKKKKARHKKKVGTQFINTIWVTV
jgi:hypothetical protein